MTYKNIQNEVIKKYNITINENSDCWRRMHAHVKTRTICKWAPKNSVANTFDLFHEIGHIMTTKSSMRRCEAEFYATQWAIDELKKYNIDIPENIIKKYQSYIDRELDRGVRRGGAVYSRMKLKY